MEGQVAVIQKTVSGALGAGDSFQTIQTMVHRVSRLDASSARQFLVNSDERNYEMEKYFQQDFQRHLSVRAELSSESDSLRADCSWKTPSSLERPNLLVDGGAW